MEALGNRSSNAYRMAFATLAQVVIREEVDLSRTSPDAVNGNHEPANGGFTVSFVIPQDGELSLAYGFITRAFSMFPPGQPTLEVYRDGVLIETDDVLSHGWPPPTQNSTFCSPIGQHTRYFYIVTATLPVGPVFAGETISFLFVTDQGTYGDGPGEGSATPGGGLVTVGGYFGANCSAEEFSFTADIVEPTFIRQDNTVVPATGDDATLMVSQVVTDVNLPASTTFDGPPGTPVDTRTYRLQSAPINTAGANVDFQIEHSRGGVVLAMYQYGSVSGPIGGDTVYRMNKHVRFVSNARPATGAAGDYDEDVNDPNPDPAPNPTDDQTIRVALDDSFRGIVLLDGLPIYDVALPVGRPASEDGPNAVRTADLRFIVLAGETANPTQMMERASEDWAQAGIRFSNTHVNSSAIPVNNGFMLTTSNPVVDGILRVRVRGVAGADGIAEVNYSAGESSRVIAARLATEISAIVWQNGNPFSAQSFDYGNFSALVMTNIGAGENIRYTELENTDTNFKVRFIIQNWVSGTIIAPAAEMLGINYGDYNMSTIDIFVVPEALVATGLGAEAKPEEYAVINQTTINGLRGQINTIVIRASQSMANDAIRPYAFGHELGHILLDGRFPGSDIDGHILGDSTIIMDSPTTEPEDVQGSKRVNTIMPGEIRTVSGINATPAILHR